MSKLSNISVQNSVKRCKICGDKAKCYNHNGLSCNPCRLFFNRNISKLDKLQCLKSENCEIDLTSRKCCSKCRITKCLAIGMQKNLIKNRYKIRKFKENLKINMKIKLPKTKLSIKTCKNPLSSKSSKFRLNQYELELIRDIQSKMRVFEDESQLQMIGVTTDQVTSMHLPGVYTRRVIKFCKSNPSFCALNSGDQLIILKRFFIECTLLKTVFDYDYKNKCGYYLVNESGTQVVLIKTTLYKGMKIYKRIFENINLGYELKKEIQNDTVIRDLTMALLLFQDRDNSCSCPEFMKYNSTLYSRLLCRYFEPKYRNVVKANKKHETLLES